jgi:hypothetical protein
LSMIVDRWFVGRASRDNSPRQIKELAGAT